jgi:hypothetical protein
MLRIQKQLLFSIIIVPVVLHAQEFLYRKIQEKDTVALTITIRQTAQGYSFKSESSPAAGKIIEEATLTKDRTALSYSYSNEKEQYAMQSKLENGLIKLNSQRKGKELQKTFKPKLVWFQVFPYDLASFVQSSADTLKLESIALYGPAALSIGGMQVVKLQNESVIVNGTSCSCLHVRIALAGFLARFWHADYWFRKSDGVFLKGIWIEKSGAKPTVTELVQGP